MLVFFTREAVLTVSRQFCCRSFRDVSRGSRDASAASRYVCTELSRTPVDVDVLSLGSYFDRLSF